MSFSEWVGPIQADLSVPLEAPRAGRRTLQWSGPGLALLALGRSPRRSTARIVMGQCAT
jgi:hypothetical protein